MLPLWAPKLISPHALPCEEVRVVDVENAGGDLRCADLRGADLSGLDLSGADLSGALLNDADLSGADLSGADLRNAHAESARFVDANLEGAQFGQAVLRFADFRGARLYDTDFCGADLEAGRNLTWNDTQDPRFCRTTTLPSELASPESKGWRFVPYGRPPSQGRFAFRTFEGLGAYVSFDWGQWPSDDVFSGGNVGLVVPLFSLDYIFPFADWGYRHVLSGIGATSYVAIGSASSDLNAIPVSNSSLALMVEVFSFLIVEFGVTYTVTPTAQLDWSTRDDTGYYAGARFYPEPFYEVAGDTFRALSQLKRR